MALAAVVFVFSGAEVEAGTRGVTVLRHEPKKKVVTCLSPKVKGMTKRPCIPYGENQEQRSATQQLKPFSYGHNNNMAIAFSPPSN